MARDFVIADVFTDEPYGGNQLAVLPDAAGMGADAMQAVAAEFGFAESTFVLPPERPGSLARVRIFTPRAELPFAGHPTVGTAAVLAHLGVLPLVDGRGSAVLDEGVGPVGVEVDGPTATLVLDPALEVSGAQCTPADVAAALGVGAGAVAGLWCAGVGMTFTFCRLAEADLLDGLHPDLARVEALAGTRELYVLAGDPLGGQDIRARMWAPALGIAEDPATGSAAAALVAWAATRRGVDGETALRITQGVAMGRPSRLAAVARVRGGVLTEVRVGGGVVVVAEGRLVAVG